MGIRGKALLLRFCSIASSLVVRTATAALMIFALLLPANAQLWGNSWG
jgi:hypothetical protein